MPLLSECRHSPTGHFTIANQVPSLVQSSEPRPIPTPIHTNEDITIGITHVVQHFEVSTLMFPILKCTCCGVVQSFHGGPDFPDKPLFSHLHLTAQPKDAYHCTGACCKGGQFWSTTRPSIMSVYYHSHGVQSNPPPNCVICDTCAKEVKSDINGLLGEPYLFR